VVAQSAAAYHEVRELKLADVQSKGLFHVFVVMQAKGGTVAELVRYNDFCHFVLKIGDRIVQPIEKTANFRELQSMETFLVEHTSRQANPVGSPKITLGYSFDVSPQDLLSPVEMILVDGDGNRITHEADLAGILDIK
jgi:hypothetical protein